MKNFFVLSENETSRTFDTLNLKAECAVEAAQKAYESFLEDNELEKTEANTWSLNVHGWRPIMIYQGGIDFNREIIWGDVVDTRSENFAHIGDRFTPARNLKPKK